jgi:hypothetical protein
MRPRCADQFRSFPPPIAVGGKLLRESRSGVHGGWVPAFAGTSGRAATTAE